MDMDEITAFDTVHQLRDALLIPGSTNWQVGLQYGMVFDLADFIVTPAGWTLIPRDQIICTMQTDSMQMQVSRQLGAHLTVGNVTSPLGIDPEVRRQVTAHGTYVNHGDGPIDLPSDLFELGGDLWVLWPRRGEKSQVYGDVDHSRRRIIFPFPNEVEADIAAGWKADIRKLTQ
jgi:hypothetical protein